MNIAIVGATGLVGRKILEILDEKKLIESNNISLYATSKSDGKKIAIGGREFTVRELCEENLKREYDIALFSAGSVISKQWVKKFVERGAYVIDNSSAFRRKKNVPLVVPEINFNTVCKNTKIIANPNCSTIGASLPIFAMEKLYKIKRIIVSTYQAVSGAGQKALLDLENSKKEKLPHTITNNLIPQIDIPLKNGYTFEEDKMDFELKKILCNKNLKISTTCVRVPIKNCHSESINVEFETRPNIDRIRKAMQAQGGVGLCDDLQSGIYPMPILSDGKDDILVGRIRRDTSCYNAINFFISFDNIRKGAALNAVQIAEKIMSELIISNK